jgi:hypothetical protein
MKLGENLAEADRQPVSRVNHGFITYEEIQKSIRENSMAAETGINQDSVPFLQSVFEQAERLTTIYPDGPESGTVSFLPGKISERFRTIKQRLQDSQQEFDPVTVDEEILSYLVEEMVTRVGGIQKESPSYTNTQQFLRILEENPDL